LLLDFTEADKYSGRRRVVVSRTLEGKRRLVDDDGKETCMSNIWPIVTTDERGGMQVTTESGTYIYPPNFIAGSPGSTAGSPCPPCPPSPKEQHPFVPQIRLWIFAALLFLVPFIYLAVKPEHYTPLVDVMFSFFLALVFYQLGNKAKIAEAESRARDRWMPQAESVAKKLLTLQASVKKLGNRVRSSCEDKACDLPEFQSPELRPIRMKLKSDCENTSERLEDIANQLDDAEGDWERFLYANCEADDCGRISMILADQRKKLLGQLSPNDGTSRASMEFKPSITETTPPA
jgi:hypothetical protein